MNDATAENLNDRFGQSLCLGEREQFPDLSDEQYQLLDRWLYIATADFRDMELEDGTLLSGPEVKYLYLAEMSSDIQSTPDTARSGLLSYMLELLGSTMAEDYDSSHDLNFMQEYFNLEEGVVREVAEYRLVQNLELGGRLANWSLVVWVKKTFPDLLTDDAFKKIIEDEERKSGPYCLGNRISSLMYHGEDILVDHYINALSLSEEFIQHQAWETFVQNKMKWLHPDGLSEVSLDEIITSKYLRYFQDRNDLVKKVEETIVEFENLLDSDQLNNRGNYETAVAVMRVIINKVRV